MTVLAPTRDRAAFKGAVAGLAAHGGTALYDGVRQAVTLLSVPGERRVVLLSDGIYEYRNAGNEEFGELRVEAVLERYAQEPSAELAARLLGAVQAFAGDAPQEDDMTVLLVKRKSEP